MNTRGRLYLALVSTAKGREFASYYRRFVTEEETGILSETSRDLLARLLDHCQRSVPYYAKVMSRIGDSFQDPEGYLRQLPILTRDVLQTHFEHLKSTDLSRRRWFENSSGGSTGQPVRFVQDWEHAARSGAITLLYSRLLGREPGDREVHLWGSARDITKGTEGWKAQLANSLSNTTMLNTFHMTSDRMRRFVDILNGLRPKLIVAYAESIYELARFCERESLQVAPQAAIISTAGMLYPLMRDKVEEVFHCRVFNRYGSREAGDIACERPDGDGLWVAPWGNYVEVVNSRGDAVPDGTEGEILVTCLTNYAMPLMRYRIGDRGVLVHQTSPAGDQRMYLQRLSGRTADCFVKQDGSIVPPEFFVHMVGVELNTGWIRKYQVIQEAYDQIDVRIALATEVGDPQRVHARDLQQISEVLQRVMGQDCRVRYTFVGDILPEPSGKYRYTISRVAAC